MRILEGLTGPHDLKLAKSVEAIPAANALPGGVRFEPKWDGYRPGIVRAGTPARLWSRNGNDLTDRFPEIAKAAARQIPEGVVWSLLVSGSQRPR